MMRALPLLLLAGCATAAGDVRDGQKVVETTGAAIAADPKAWDGKWVRVQGILSANGHALYTPKSAALEGIPLGWADGSLLLNPADHTDDDEAFEASETPASVTGRVRTVCWEFWTPILAKMEADAARGLVYTYHPMPPQDFKFCATVSGPFLEDAVIEPIRGNAALEAKP